MAEQDYCIECERVVEIEDSWITDGGDADPGEWFVVAFTCGHAVTVKLAEECN